MAVLIREGSVSKDLRRARPKSSTPNTSRFVALCTDDRNPLDIAEEGHLDHLDPPADRHGPAAASRLSRRQLVGGARLRPDATAAWSRRAGAPISCCSTTSRTAAVAHVIAGGRLVDAELFARARAGRAGRARPSMKAEPVTPGDLRRARRPRRNDTPVIGVMPGQIITERARTSTCRSRDGCAAARSRRTT